MAMCDYALCDKCEGKAFYDANIHDPRYCATYDPTEDADPIGIAVLCSECNKKYKAIIAPRTEMAEAEERGAARERDACADLLEAGKEWVAARNAILHTTAPTPETLASWDRLATAEASLAAAICALKGEP